MEIIETLIQLISQYPILFSFLGGVFGGEETLFALAFLAYEGVLPFWTVFVFALLGELLVDAVLFVLSETFFLKFVRKKEWFKKTYNQVDGIVQRYSKGNNFVTLLSTKFVYGLRMATIIYLRARKLSVWRFTFINIFVSIIWMSVVMIIGIFAAQGFNYIIDTFKNIQLALTFVVFVLILFFIIKRWLTRKLIPRQRA